MERIKLYLDEDTISRALIAALRARGIDVLTAQEVGQIGVDDDVQLAFAIEQGRTLFTFNTRDFVQLHARYLADAKSHKGIIVSDQVNVGVITRRLLKLIDARMAEDMVDWLEFLSNWR